MPAAHSRRAAWPDGEVAIDRARSGAWSASINTTRETSWPRSLVWHAPQTFAARPWWRSAALTSGS